MVIGCVREAAKSSFFSGPATQRGRVRDWPLRKNNFFFEIWPLSSRGGGGSKALVAGPLKENFLLRLPLYALQDVEIHINEFFYKEAWVTKDVH